MNTDKKPLPIELKFIVDNLTEPIIFKNIIDYWTKLNLDVWKNEFKNAQLPFRRGFNFKCKCSKDHPQWEYYTEIVHLTFDEFLEKANTDNDHWYYFDYKRIFEWIAESSEVYQLLSWAEFGYPGKKASDNTLWIGNKGAHTPCHIDTYENNLVLQIYGNKRWILFPPETDLKPTRIPYEESSIYSHINFYPSDSVDISAFKGAREVILEPGDVLFVPQGWWHYVETISHVAISVNSWILSSKQKEAHLKESIVQLLVAQATKHLSDSCIKLLVNPNNEETLSEPLNVFYDQVKYCYNHLMVENGLEKEGKSKQLEHSEHPDSFTIDDILNKYSSFIRRIESCAQTRKSDENPDKSQLATPKCTFCEKRTHSTDIDFTKKIINALCHPDVVNLICTKLLDQHSVSAQK